MILMKANNPLALVLLLNLILPASHAFAGQQAVTRERSVILGGSGSYMGIEMEDVTSENMAMHKLSAERGVIVRRVEKNSPAEEAGIKENDVILEYLGMPVHSTAQFARMVRETPAGRKVDLAISREGKNVHLSAKVGKRDDSTGVRVGRLGSEPGGELRFEGPAGRSFSFRTPDKQSLENWYVWRGDGPAIGLAVRPRLGVTIEPLTDQMAEFLGVPGKKGVLVTSVVEGSPAAGKLKAGDVITRADDQTIDQPGDLQQLLRRKGDSARIDLKIIRDKKETTLAIELADSSQKTSRSGHRL